jgi:hypothetical protein
VRSGFRRNGFAFDLNQDHLVRTQVETEGKLALMKQVTRPRCSPTPRVRVLPFVLPAERRPRLPRDAREHRSSDLRPVRSGVRARVPAQRLAVLQRGYGYDLFAPRFTDTIAVMAYAAAGMTIEVYDGAPLDRASPGTSP